MGDAQFTLLDVGQGLASVIQTNKHILIFDTGAKLGSSNDMGESVLVPYLRSIGIKKIDMLVVSHGDNDHIGGAAALQKNFVINEIKTSALDKFKSANLCLQGQKWIWDEVNFEILYPTRELLGEGNDSSCVLRVSTKQHSILLTGDIEKKSEKYLLTNNILLKSDVIVVPHHGSKTSGLPDFIQAVNPTIALFPVGYRNRYHFPNPTVLNTYQNNNSQLFTSVTSGAIFITLNNKSILQPIEYRTTHAKFWNHKI
jgi:competence protein ComEC